MGPVVLTAPATMLARSLRAVRPFTGATNAATERVSFEATSKGPVLVATDSYTLAVASIPHAEWVGEPRRFLLSRDSVGDAIEGAEDWAVAHPEDHVPVTLTREGLLDVGEREMLADLFDWLPWRRMIPAESRGTILMGYRTMQRIAKQAEVVGLDLVPGDSRLFIANQDPMPLDAGYRGEPVRVAVNASFLARCMRFTDARSVSVGLDRHPFEVRGSGHVALCMPVVAGAANGVFGGEATAPAARTA